MNYKNLRIGSVIKLLIDENKINPNDISTHFKIPENELINIYNAHSMDSEKLLQWSKFLDYDLFRIYSQHLILYSPPINSGYAEENKVKKKGFKNIYTKEIIEFVLEQLESGEKTTAQIIEDYRIPKNTLHKWRNKYTK
ncbi:transposase [Chryseobacterium shigense]|uniref:Uncharacterized protein n=1 Tax=Chryseobacterium shigense TaxID=297244 RepID=A0A841N3Y6_9FLAO|nr:transposase [Chryseobacterium shigense]MBB6371846.1 hypothetical protein [Chryseobacterium shigense]